MVAIALQAAASTGGLVDPTLGEAIEAAGYDRDFGRLGPSPSPPRPAAPGRWRAVRASERALSRPIGVAPRPQRRREEQDGRRRARIDLWGRLRLGRRRHCRARRARRRASRRRRRAPRRRRPGDERQRKEALASRRRVAAPSDRPRNGRAGPIAVGRGDDLRGDVPSVRRRRQGGFPARPRRPGVSRRARSRRSLSRAFRRDRLHEAVAVVRASRGVNGVAWEAARAGGIVAYVLLSAVVVIGLALSGRERLEGWPRFAIEDVHRFAGMLVGAFVSLHVVTIAIDSEAHFSLLQLVVPFASSYRPLWTGARHRRCGAARRARGREPLPQAHLVPALAASPLPQLRRVARGDVARHRRGHRQRLDVASLDLRRRDRRRRALHRTPHPPHGAARQRLNCSSCHDGTGASSSRARPPRGSRYPNSPFSSSNATSSRPSFTRWSSHAPRKTSLRSQ